MGEAGHGVDLMLRDGEPVWDLIDFELACPRCGYNLRMLTRPRCPECGLDFDWRAVLDRAAWTSDFLFEHHWRNRPIRSWFTTVWRSFRPFKFWRSVSIHERVEVPPLLFMLVGSILVFMAVLQGTAWLLSLLFSLLEPANPFGSGAYSYAGPGTYGRLSGYLEALARWPLDDFEYYWPLPCGVLLTLVAALALLSSLRQTLGRCRVRTKQLLRVTAYISTPVAVAAASFFLLCVVLGELLQPDNASTAAIVLVVTTLAAPILTLGVFLASGLRCYLRLPRALLLGFTAAGVAVLFTLTASVVGSLAALF